MGLAICRTIVERHGGLIAVEKVVEGGARFSFTVPDRRMWTSPATAVGRQP
jgi:signal transduction histidine kinase